MDVTHKILFGDHLIVFVAIVFTILSAVLLHFAIPKSPTKRKTKRYEETRFFQDEAGQRHK